jgi:hypothetical protein
MPYNIAFTLLLNLIKNQIFQRTKVKLPWYFFSMCPRKESLLFNNVQILHLLPVKSIYYCYLITTFSRNKRERYG